MTALRDRLPEVLLGGLLQLLQDHRGDLAAARSPCRWPSTAHVAVGRRARPWYGTIFISSLTSSKRRPMKRLIEKTVFSGLVTAWRLATWPTSRSPVLANADDRRRQPAAFRVGDDDGLAAFHDGDDGVGGAQVDADDFAH